jgi:NAD(P)-dependent dehydrogenase (short-subunit alcohol dehydrogenase family)
MQPRSVVITGSSTGIGEACALSLDRRGWRVFATVRREADGQRLASQASERFEWLLLDVTDPLSIGAAAEQVASRLGEAPLDGLVNNAGIATGGPVEFVSLEQYRRAFEVNVVGLVAVTQAFLPLLRRGRGRIVNIGSIGGRVSSPMVSPYCASKHAVGAISDALRIELAPWGLHTSVIEPGVVVTPIWDKGLKDMDSAMHGLPPAALERYARLIRAFRRILAGAPRRGVPVGDVARVVERALVSRRPRHRYVVGTDARVRLALQTILPRRWMDAIVQRVLDRAAGPG